MDNGGVRNGRGWGRGDEGGEGGGREGKGTERRGGGGGGVRTGWRSGRRGRGERRGGHGRRRRRGRGKKKGGGRPVLYLVGQRQNAFHLHILPEEVPHTYKSRPVLGNRQSSG